MKAIVTGGAGFIGSHLVELLADREWEVLVLDDLSTGRIDNLATARRRGVVSVHVAGVEDPELPDVVGRFGPDVVFHLAAQASVSRSVEDPLTDARVNVLGTVNVLEAARRAGVRKVCFASSGGAIYGGDAKLPVKESASKVPESPYGISKKVAEDWFRWYREAHGVDSTLLAPANVYGPRQDPGLEGGVVAIFATSMLEGRRPTIFGDGRQTRDFVYVEDVCDAFLRAVDAGSGRLINLGSGQETTIADLYDAVAEAVGYPVKPEFGPPRSGDVERSAVDAALAKKELGWQAWTTLEHGLRQTVEWYRSL